jgi:hypothetical protein
LKPSRKTLKEKRDLPDDSEMDPELWCIKVFASAERSLSQLLNGSSYSSES